MRSSSMLVLLLLSACGGGIAPGSDKQTSGGPGTDGTSSGSSGGTTSGSGGSASGTSTRCTPGAYVFCRCGDRSEGTKRCIDGASFEACTCSVPGDPVCSYPAPNNPPGCPSSYSYTYQGQPCDPLNLECRYPGAGDAQSDGCFSTALLACRVSPGGAQSWVAAQ